MKGFTLIEIMVVVVIIGLLLALLLPAISGIYCAVRAGNGRAILDQVTQAAAAYNRDHNQYPPSDPSFQSAPLVRALVSGRRPYMTFRADDLDRQGNILNPVRSTETVKYRRNAGDPAAGDDPSAHNKQGIDLWFSGCRGIPDEENNW